MRAATIVPFLIAAAAVQAFAGPALDAVADHVSTRAREPGLDGRERRVLTKLERKLGAPDEPGARDDFKKLQAVARAVRRPLSSDTVLAGLADAALDEAAQTLATTSADVVQVLVLVELGHKRSSLERLSSKASGLRERYVLDRAGGGTGLGPGARAARTYGKCLAKARKALARQDGRDPAWRVVFSGLGGALLSAWADSDPVAPSVYVVGADDGADGPLFMRLGGEGWVRLPVPHATDLWWVAGVPGDGASAGSVWTCGSGGVAVRYDTGTGAIQDRSPPGVAHTLFGLWGAAEDDVWVVGGGQAEGGGSEPVVRHWNGASWTAPALPEQAATRTLFKVWGRASDDVWACGEGGIILHFDGTEWALVSSGTTATLLTLHGNGDAPIVAVGAPGSDAVIAERQGNGAFAPIDLPTGLDWLNGVAVDATGDAWAAGMFGAVMRREKGTWDLVKGVPTPGALDHHGVAIDGAGGVWFAGGSLRGTLDDGFLLYRGTRAVPDEVFPQATLRGQVAPLLSASCATIGCHLEPFANEGLDFYTPESVHRGTVGVASHQSPLLRIVPGHPSQSYLWHKLLGSQIAVGGSGFRMPNSGDGLDQPSMDLIQAWILEGALDDDDQ